MSTEKSKFILAIDLGTSGPKVALVTTHGEVVNHEFEEIELLLLPQGGAEQRPGDWWEAIKKATKRVISKSSISKDEIVAISCTAQWSGTVAVDRQGNSLMNAIIWMDARGAENVKQITGGIITFKNYGLGKLLRWMRLTGGVPGHSGKDPIAHILFIKNKLPDIYQATYKFLEPKDYINLKLTGKFAASYDSITLHWLTDNRNLAHITKDNKLIKWSTIDPDKLPDLKRAVDILGTIQPEIAAELGLNEKVKVVMGTPDIHSAAIGSGAVKNYEPHLYIGTSSWLICHVPFKKTDIVHNMASLPSAIPDRYLVANEQQTAGVCLTYLRDNIFFHEDELMTENCPQNVYETFDRIAEKVPAGSDKVIFTPWLYGERTPVENHTIRGGFHNQSLKTTREHLIRAVFEGVAYNSRWLLKYVEKFINQKFEEINMVGGGANSNIWCQIHADVLNRTIKQVKKPILANVRGAAFLASVALGYLTFEDIPEYVQIANTYKPNPLNRPIYDDLFKEFLNLYRKNKNIHVRLNCV